MGEWQLDRKRRKRGRRRRIKSELVSSVGGGRMWSGFGGSVGDGADGEAEEQYHAGAAVGQEGFGPGGGDGDGDGDGRLEKATKVVRAENAGQFGIVWNVAVKH